MSNQCQRPKTWVIWKKDGFYSVAGPNTDGRVEVMEVEPTRSLVKWLSSEFNIKFKSLLGFEFWVKLKELFSLYQ